jgi:hypothetical protein
MATDKNITISMVKFVVLIITFLIPSVAFVVWFNYRLWNVEIETDKLQDTTTNITTKINDNDIRYTEIKVTLEQIKISQADILRRLK